MPADLLPLRLYTAKVDKDGNVTTSIARTHPIRLFYDVALKDGVRDKVAKPDAAMSQYIAQHTDASGDVYFLTNAYDTSAQPAAANGTTTAVFTPATTNDFYYFTPGHAAVQFQESGRPGEVHRKQRDEDLLLPAHVLREQCEARAVDRRARQQRVRQGGCG